MALTPVPPINPVLPPAPNPQDEEAVFDAEAYDFTTALAGFGDDVKAIGDATYANAQYAETKAAESEASASNASDSATASAASALASSNSANASAASAVEAANLVEKYQGALASDPTLDKTGNPLTDGDWYVNSTTGFIRAYTASGGWVNGVTAISGVSSVNGMVGDVSVTPHQFNFSQGVI